MDAVEFLKTKKRMCESYVGSCRGCPICNERKTERVSCDKYMCKYPEKAVAIVKKWSEEHPIKTRQSEFLKHYPDAKIEDGVIRICPKMMKKDFNLHLCGNNQEACRKCRSNYWLEEIFEDPENEG